MLTLCSECNTMQEIKLDPKTEKAVCTSCHKEVNLSSFTIRSMKDRREFLEKKKQAFAFHCENCKETQPGVLAPKKNFVKCSVCGKKMNVTEHMLNTLKVLNPAE